jgi:hypothetical protein
MALIRAKRGTRAQIDAAATGGTLNEGEPYLIADEDRLAVGTGASDYAESAMLGADNTFAGANAFGVVTGTAVTVSSPGTAQSVALDGRCHVIELADGINTEITGIPQSGYSNCLVRIKQPAVGSGTISWPGTHRNMGGSELNTASDSFSDFMLDSHDGSTVLYRGVGVEQ